MFHVGTKLQNKEGYKNIKKNFLTRVGVFDELIVALAMTGLMCNRLESSGDIFRLFVSGVLVWPYRGRMERKEAWVFLGALHWVLCRTKIPMEMFYSIGVMHKSMPAACALRHMAFYGIRSAISEITGSVEGLLIWGFGFLYFLASALIMCFLFYLGASVNAKRKLFHAVIFFYYSVVPIRVVRVQTVCLLFLVQLFSKLLEIYGPALNMSEKVLLKGFLSQKDRKAAISHSLLLLVFLFSIEVMEDDRPRLFFVLSSVGIVDGLSSFFPKSEGTHKSRIGSFVGALAARIVLRTFFCAKYPLWMYLLLGAGEYFSQMNDNILLPILAYGISGMHSRYLKDAQISLVY